MDKVRMQHIDALKGFAILLVVVGHVFWFSADQYSDVSIYKALANIHMPLFVMLSGFFASKPLELSANGVGAFWKNKASRLLLPLITIPTLYSWTSFGFGLPLRVLLYEYWFTYSLFIIFIFFYIQRGITQLLVSPDKTNPFLEIGISAVFIAGIGIFVDLISEHTKLISWFHLNNVNWLYRYFVLGYLMSKLPKIDQLMRQDISGFLSALCYIGCSVVILQRPPTFDKTFFSVESIMCLSGLIFAYYTASRITDNQRILSKTMIYLGQISLPIYLTHYFFIPSLPWIGAHLDGITSPALRLGWEVFIGFGVATLILLPTIIVIKWVRANPYLAFVLYGEPVPRTKRSEES